MSTLHVENLKGLSSGGNANKVIIPTGQTLEVTDNIRHDDMPSGSVVQVVTSNKTNSTQITSTSAVDTGLSVSITPKFNTSKIFISLSTLGICYNTQYIIHRLLRDSTIIYGDAGYNNNNYWMPLNYAINHLEGPATTSAITYKTMAYISNSGGDIRFNYNGDCSAHTASITAMEIAA